VAILVVDGLFFFFSDFNYRIFLEKADDLITFTIATTAIYHLRPLQLAE
jgi:hypothetical protein